MGLVCARPSPSTAPYRSPASSKNLSAGKNTGPSDAPPPSPVPIRPDRQQTSRARAICRCATGPGPRPEKHKRTSEPPPASPLQQVAVACLVDFPKPARSRHPLRFIEAPAQEITASIPSQQPPASRPVEDRPASPVALASCRQPLHRIARARAVPGEPHAQADPCTPPTGSSSSIWNARLRARLMGSRVIKCPQNEIVTPRRHCEPLRGRRSTRPIERQQRSDHAERKACRSRSSRPFWSSPAGFF